MTVALYLNLILLDIVIHFKVCLNVIVDSCKLPSNYFTIGTITSSCFPLMYSNGTVGGRCYERECGRYDGSQELFYVVTIPG